MFCAPQAKGVLASGKEMDLCRDARLIKGTRINRAVADVVHGVIPRLQQESRRRPLCDVYAGVQGSAVAAQVARIKGYSEVWAAA